METMLEVKNVRVFVGGKEILHSVSAKIAAGRRIVILGPNGSGKSTLLKAMAGLLPYEGSVLFEGRELKKLARRALAKDLAVLPQGGETPPDLTVYELVSYGRFPHRRLFGRGGAEDEKAIDWALARTNLETYRARLVRNLSGGERQRAWIALALAQKPRLLFLDEPTTYLDVAHQLDVLFTVSALNREEKLTVVMVLHDVNHAVQFADEIILVKDGRIVGQGAPQLLDEALLRRLFGVKAQRFTLKDGGGVFVPYDLARREK